MNRTRHNETDRRDETRGSDRRQTLDIFKVADRVAANAARISALLTFPPMMLSVDADDARAEAATLAALNTYLVGMV